MKAQCFKEHFKQEYLPKSISESDFWEEMVKFRHGIKPGDEYNNVCLKVEPLAADYTML